jgi:RNA 3'-terminal phosphate cyclase (ATP)
VEGDTLGSTALTFRPRGFVGGEHHFAVGTAGSALLVFQAVLPALLGAKEPTRLVLEGGTHNPSAPPFDFVAKTFLPVLATMGAKVTATLQRPGFYPAGGGRLVVEVEPAPLRPLELVERGALRGIVARVIVSAVSDRIAHRELKVLRDALGLPREALRVEGVDRPLGPGNVVFAEAECDALTEVFTGFGERGRSAEEVAGEVLAAFVAWRDRGAPVGEHLADQLIVPLALAGGRFRTGPLSSHAATNLESVRPFLDRAPRAVDVGEGIWEIVA